MKSKCASQGIFKLPLVDVNMKKFSFYQAKDKSIKLVDQLLRKKELQSFRDFEWMNIVSQPSENQHFD